MKLFKSFNIVGNNLSIKAQELLYKVTGSVKYFVIPGTIIYNSFVMKTIVSSPICDLSFAYKLLMSPFIISNANLHNLFKSLKTILTSDLLEFYSKYYANYKYISSNDYIFLKPLFDDHVCIENVIILSEIHDCIILYYIKWTRILID